jgi:hypothetical protein
VSNYYRGAQPTGRDYGDLASLGVKMLINYRAILAHAAPATVPAIAATKTGS